MTLVDRQETMPVGQLACKECGKTFSRQDKLMIHIQMHHQPQQRIPQVHDQALAGIQHKFLQQGVLLLLLVHGAPKAPKCVTIPISTRQKFVYKNH
jgi:hypothetical protein